MATFASSSAAALNPESIIKSFLADCGFEVSLEQASSLNSTLGIADSDNRTAVARQFAQGLRRFGLDLKHTKILDLLARLAGNSNHQQWLQGAGAAVNAFELVISVEEDTANILRFRHIGDAVRALYEIVGHAQGNNEPALCDMKRSRSGFGLDIRPKTSPWFEVTLRHISQENRDAPATPCAMSDTVLRKTCFQVVETLSQLRPTMLVSGGLLPRGMAPIARATFRIVAEVPILAECEAAAEATLFQLFEDEVCSGMEPVGCRIAVEGRSTRLYLEPEWLDSTVTSTDRELKAVSATLWARYLQYRAAVRQDVGDVVRDVQGYSGGLWFAKVDYRALSSAMKEQRLDHRQLAKKARVSYRDVRTMDHRKHVSPALLMAVAQALQVEDPSRLLLYEDTPSFELPVASAGMFVELVRGAQHVDVQLPDRSRHGSDGPMAELAARVHDAAKSIAKALSSAHQVSSQLQASVESLRALAGTLIEELAAAGYLMFLAHDVDFGCGIDPLAEPWKYTQLNMLNIQLEHRPPGFLESYRQLGL
ncbi:hypothetical protein VOM14_18700 [Paraburkholderia sp. MPAMCS5]|uniref:hypothetical protein n=1 Tax=Paraburkholderia sp. MPAMCS5 TaxID=3112563 RepID=UPI002E188151|nr:hypothetical protein [Paraburkholderia sp. MPAMCS5]